MRLFKRGRAKSEHYSSTDESQKSWGVFRLFQNTGGALMSKEPAAATAAVCLMEPPASKANSTTNSIGNRTPPTYNFANQNFTPEVALSPELKSLSPSKVSIENRHNAGDEAQSREKSQSDKHGKNLSRYETWSQQRKPRFHFGPRQANEDEPEEKPGSTSASDGESENIIAQPPKFAFIYQDGKFVEREVTKWPKPQRALPHQRYRITEPYSKNYGRRYRKRISSSERITSQRYRCIYQNPIYMLPRKIMEENKIRLIKRHSLKDRIEGPNMFAGPQSIRIGQETQSKIIQNMVERHNYKEAETLVNYITASKAKARDGKT